MRLNSFAAGSEGQDALYRKARNIIRQFRWVENVTIHEAVGLVGPFDAHVGIDRCAALAKGCTIEVRAVGGSGCACWIESEFGLTPADHLTIDPECLAGAR